LNFNVFLDNRDIEVILENKKSIKHCYLRILNKNLIQIKANRYFTLLDAKELIFKKENWIIQTLKKHKQQELNSDEFLYLGEKKLLSEFKIKNIDKFYKQELQKILPPIIEEFSNKMQLFPTKISYRKNKRTWGSCNYKNELNFNILLIKYPLIITKYIVVHELAHIKYKNHSKNFWALVEKFCPDYKEVEKLFKTLL